MKKFFMTLLFSAVCLLLPAVPGAEPVSLELPIAGMDEETLNHVLFEYGYEAVAQNACKGAVLYFLPGDVYIAGTVSDSTPDDYCVDVPSGTVGCWEFVPTEIAVLYADAMHDALSVSTLRATESDAVLMVVMFTPYEGMTLLPDSYASAKRALEKKAIAAGFRVPDFYAELAKKGIGEQDAVLACQNSPGKADELVHEALMARTTTGESHPYGTALAVILCILIIAIAVIAFVAAGGAERHGSNDENC